MIKKESEQKVFTLNISTEGMRLLFASLCEAANSRELSGSEFETRTHYKMEDLKTMIKTISNGIEGKKFAFGVLKPRFVNVEKSKAGSFLITLSFKGVKLLIFTLIEVAHGIHFNETEFEKRTGFKRAAIGRLLEEIDVKLKKQR